MDPSDIQSVVLRGYPREGLVRYHLLSFEGGEPRRMLTRLVTDVASADEAVGARARRQFALTAFGLRALGLSAADMAQFPREFRQGMAHPERALALGHVAGESPEHWEFGGPNTPRIDALWLTLSQDHAELAELSLQYERLFARFGIACQVHDATPSGDERAPVLRRGLFRRFPLGELVLGERDAIGERTVGPLLPIKHSARPLPAWVRARNAQDFGQNGSYLALCKLAREKGTLWVGTFHTDLRRQFEIEHHVARLAGGTAGRMLGGGYFFLPSVSALNYLAEG